MLAEDGDEHEEREMIEWIARRGGHVTTRELQSAMRKRFATSDKAEAALESLVPHIGRWVEVPSGPKGGRPTSEFHLNDGASTTQAPKENP
jgi:hypothetical protein